MRALSLECAVDPGRLTLHWIQGVAPDAGLKWLASLVDGGVDDDDAGEQALVAMALYRGEEASRLLTSYMDRGHRMELREKAAFWVGNMRGRAGLEPLRRFLRDDPSAEFRKKVIFALTQVDAPEAIDAIVQAAHDDRDSNVRGEALFWLAQEAGEKIAGRKAADALDDAIENDPDTDVKKKAVFALSQMPADEGVPRLIELARNHKNREVRRDAMFWLGQSGDPRALAFIEKILTD
jgi:HEAT repeat protein